MDRILSPQQSCVEAQIASTSYCNFIWSLWLKESNWDKIGPLGWTLIQSDHCPYKRRLGHIDQETPGARMHRGMTTWRGSKRMVIWKTTREDSGDTNPAGTLILDFQPPELWERKFLLFKPPGLWYFPMAALMKTAHTYIPSVTIYYVYFATSIRLSPKNPSPFNAFWSTMQTTVDFTPKHVSIHSH